MINRIYMTNRKPGLMSEKPHLAFSSMLVGSAIITFLMAFTTGMVFLSFIIPTIITTMIVVTLNHKYNVSASICFIDKDSKLYAIRLLKCDGVYEKSDRNIIYTPGGSTAQIATLPHNIEAAKEEHKYTRSLNAIRRNPEIFITALEHILEFIETHPRRYKPTADAQRSFSEKWTYYNLENEGLEPITIDKNEKYSFLRLNNPQIIEEKFGAIKIRFLNEKKKECTVKITDCYDGLKEDIKAGKFN